MKTLVIGAGPLGSLYAVLLHKAGNDVTILARNEHYIYLKKHGVILVNEFTQEKIVEKIPVIDTLDNHAAFDLAIVIMRKNSVKAILPLLGKSIQIPNFLFMGNNALGFEEYLKHLPKEKVLFGFPGGGGSRIDHVVHYVDSEKPGGTRMPITLGEVDGITRSRTRKIQQMFNMAGVPAKLVADMDGWLKYHVAFVNPIAGALLKCGDNYKLAKDKETIRTYLRAVKEGGNVLKALGYKKSYNVKLDLFYWMPEFLLINILKKVFDSKFAEVAMMMHANAAKDEMLELGKEFKSLTDKTSIPTLNLDELIRHISTE